MKSSHGGNSGNRKGTKSFMGDIDPSRIQSINVVKAPELYSKVINNPIELPEKK
jgi:hypothetical protein